MNRTKYRVRDFVPMIGIARYHVRNSKELQEDPNGRASKKFDLLAFVNGLYMPVIAAVGVATMIYGPQIKTSIENLLK